MFPKYCGVLRKCQNDQAEQVCSVHTMILLFTHVIHMQLKTVHADVSSIPDICHGRHRHVRVIFFGRCKF